MNNPVMTSKYSSERKRYTSLNLNQKLGMMQLSEEGTWKVKTGQQLGLLPQTASHIVTTKGKVLEGIKTLL